MDTHIVWGTFFEITVIIRTNNDSSIVIGIIWHFLILYIEVLSLFYILGRSNNTLIIPDLDSFIIIHKLNQFVVSPGIFIEEAVNLRFAIVKFFFESLIQFS